MQDSLHDTASDVSSPDILIVSRTFLPEVGGIQEYAYNRCLQDPARVIVLTAACTGDQLFDQAQPFLVYRWSIPKFLLHFGILGSVFKQVFNIVWSFLLGIKLFLRYRYHYIEWCHGYDFPALLLLSYVLPIHFFIYLHGDDVLCPLKNPVLRLLFEWTLKRAKGIVCNSSFTQEYLKTHFYFDTPTHIIHPTVRLEKFGIKLTEHLPVLGTNVRKNYNIPENALLILSVGRLVRRKGFDRVIENMPILLAEGINIYYLICGRGSIESELRLLTKKLEIEERVIFAGYVPDDQLASYYTACDFFAMLTFFDAQDKSIEGFGIVYLEAGCFGKPVIASRVGGVEDAVHNGENGILVDPNSTEEILDSLRQLCLDQQLRLRLGCKGRELANRQTLHQLLYDQIPAYCDSKY